MDFYRNVISGGHSEEIRKLVRKRDGSNSEEPYKKRPRADTNALVPQIGGQDIEEPQPPESPKPEENINKYDRERLQKGLHYVNGALKQKITPRTRTFLQFYKDTYKVALDGQLDDPARAVVQALDRVYSSSAFYFRPRRSEEMKDFEGYMKLRRMKMLANYGDYLGQDLSNIRSHLKAVARARNNDDLREAARLLGDPGVVKTIAREPPEAEPEDLRKYVGRACLVLKLDVEHTLWLVKEWDERNSTFHNLLRQRIAACSWFDLAQQIFRDINELRNFIGDDDLAAKFEKVLTSIRDEYFDVGINKSYNGWKPRAWETERIRQPRAWGTERIRQPIKEKAADVKKRAEAEKENKRASYRRC
ncbi:MAG: hypothetical protein LQ351_003542 [Letrouitia transgressa]|nr:MAG: hypothetical protein LQ351_003542 [Letrouitia transgressa]